MQYNSEVDLDSQDDLNFEVLQRAILDELNDSRDTMRSVELNNPSNNPEIMESLGCTESCFFCGSLCWGQAGHSENHGTDKKHHCCHQPSGLGGASHKTKHYLISKTCDAFKDDQTMYWYKCPEGMSWLQTKQHSDFVDSWIFTAHSRMEFNDLMKWFFVKLHEEISRKYDELPARPEDLQNFGTLHSLDHILNTIRLRV